MIVRTHVQNHAYANKNRRMHVNCPNLVHDTDCECKAVFFSESTQSIKSQSDEHRRFAKNCDCEKYQIAKHYREEDNFSWNQKNVVDKESWLLPRKIKETIYSVN